VTFARVRPVRDVNTAVGTRPQSDSHEPRVTRQHKVGTVGRGVSRPAATQDIVVDAATVYVAHENAVAVLRRERITEINQCAAMRMAPSQRQRFWGFSADPVRFASRVVEMIGTSGKTFVGVQARRAIAPRLVVPSLDDVEQVRVDAVGNEALAEI